MRLLLCAALLLVSFGCDKTIREPANHLPPIRAAVNAAHACAQ